VIHQRIDQLLDNVNERYALVIVAAKRARQINNYHHQLGEGTFDDNPPPLVESRSKNYLTMALEEISEGKVRVGALVGRPVREREEGLAGHEALGPMRDDRDHLVTGADEPARQVTGLVGSDPTGHAEQHEGHADILPTGTSPPAVTIGLL
jgi:DNA-directed RNA polymerase subunit omega